MEILNDCPKSVAFISDYFIKQLTESSKGVSLNEKLFNDLIVVYKDLDYIKKIVLSNPRILFELMDEHDILIQINVYDKDKFSYSINDSERRDIYSTRKEAEVEAIKEAIEILDTL